MRVAENLEAALYLDPAMLDKLRESFEELERDPLGAASGIGEEAVAQWLSEFVEALERRE